jgi:hypothetical protein
VIGPATRRILWSTQEETGSACENVDCNNNVMVGQEVDTVKVLLEYTYVQVRGFHDGDHNHWI